MKKSFPVNLKTIFFRTVFLSVISAYPVTARSICHNEVGALNGYTYELWMDSGTGCMEFSEGGGFSLEWSGENNIMARMGLRPGSREDIIIYAADYRPDGNSYLCAYGWTQNPGVEYYIIDNWGTWRPPGGEGFKGSLVSDDGIYEIYRTQRYGAASPYYQYWSVRQTKRSSGTISVGNHFSAWEALGMSLGELAEVSFCVEGYQSNGSADVYEMSISRVPAQTTPVPALLRGDVDGNGRVNIVDALMVAQYSVGFSMPGNNWHMADTNCDGIINIVDALMIGQYAVQLISAWPDCTPPNLALVGSLKSATGTRSGWKTTGIKENILFIAGESGMMQLYDISSTPRFLKELDIGEIGVSRLTIEGDFLYLCSSPDECFQIYDVTTPANPLFLIQKKVAGAGDFTFSNQHAYLNIKGKLVVYDCRIPSQITKVGEVPVNTLNSACNHVSLWGNYACIPGFSGCVIVDIAQPSNPVVIGDLPINNFGNAQLAFAGNYAFGSCNDSLYVIDISDPAAPVLARHKELGLTAGELTMAGRGVLILGAESALHLLDITDPLDPVSLDSYRLPVKVNDLYFAGETLYTVYSYTGGYYYADGLFGSVVEFLDVTTAGEFRSLFTLDSSGYPVDVKIKHPYAFLADGKAGIKIIDISDPSLPCQVGGLDTLDAGNLVVAGDIVYLADGPGGMKSIDVSDPGFPVLLDTVLLDNVKDLSIQGDYAYVADYPEGLSIVDISDPAHLQVAYKVPNPNAPGYDYQRPKPKKVVVSGKYVYLLKNQIPELEVYDVSDPRAPRIISDYLIFDNNFVYSLGDLFLNRNLLYVISGNHRLNILDVTEPEVPRLLSSDYLGRLYRVAFYDNYLFGICEPASSTHIPDTIIADVSNPAGSVAVGAFRPVDTPLDVAVGDDYLYITGKNNGPDLMWVYKIE